MINYWAKPQFEFDDRDGELRAVIGASYRRCRTYFKPTLKMFNNTRLLD